MINFLGREYYTRDEANKILADWKNGVQVRDTRIANMEKSLSVERADHANQLKKRDSYIKVLQEKIKSMEVENNDLQAQPIEYVKQPIVVQCPYCDHQEEIESTGNEPIIVAKVLAQHLQDYHIPPELIETEMYSHCGSCFLNFANIEKIRQAQLAKEIEIRNLQADIPLEYFDDEGNLAVVGAFVDGKLQMLRIPRKYLNENPVSIEDGLYYVYKDGKKLHRSIIVNLREHNNINSSPTTGCPSQVIEAEKIPSTPLTAEQTTHSPSSEPSKGVFTKDEEKQIAEAVVAPHDVVTIKSRDKNTVKRDESTTTTPSTIPKPRSVTKEKIATKGSTHLKLTRAEKIANYLSKHPNSSNQNIADALDLDKSNVSKILKNLLDQKKVSLEGNLYSWIGEP